MSRDPYEVSIKDLDLESIIMALMERKPLMDAIENPRRPWDRFHALRKLYALIDGTERDPYQLDWLKVFTKIERHVWEDIRCAGVTMWPQYPVGRRFVDFADPRLHIGIECDGKAWHNEAQDLERDSELGAMGWTIFRVDGSACLRTITPEWEGYYQEGERNDWDTPPEVKRWLRNTSEGLVEAMGVYYYGNLKYRFKYDDVIDVLVHRASKATPFIARTEEY